MEKDRDPETDRALQVSLAVSGAKEKSREVVEVTDFRPLWIVLLERVTADVALCPVLILFSLLGTHALNRAIRPELLHDRRLPLDEHVQEPGERILTDLRHDQLIVLAESRAEDGRRGAHFMLLKVSSLLCLATKRLDDGLEVRIDHERRHGAKLVVKEFELRLFKAGRREHMEHRHEIVSIAELLVARENFLR